MALLVLATWLLMWFSDVCGSGLLSAHYTHFRLRLRSQLGLLLQRRRTWLVVSAIVALDSFCISLNTSYVYQMPNVRLACRHSLVLWWSRCWRVLYVVCCTIGACRFGLALLLYAQKLCRIGMCLRHVLDAWPCFACWLASMSKRSAQTVIGGCKPPGKHTLCSRPTLHPLMLHVSSSHAAWLDACDLPMTEKSKDSVWL